MTTPPTRPRPVFTLDPYAATSCPVKTQNQFLPGMTRPQQRLDEALVELFEGGKAFENEVLDAMVAGAGDDVVDLRGLRESGSWEETEQACLQAMSAGVGLIVGGILPRDLAGHRRGSADAWVRGADTEDGRPGYLPVEAKFHKVTERRMTGRSGHVLLVSALAAPQLTQAMEVPDVGFRLSSREADLIQLAHYTRLLQSVGHAAAGEPHGGIVGTDEIPGVGRGVVWTNLRTRQLRTFSRTAQDGWRLRSPMERYDHEHGFRARVVRNAVTQADPEPAPLLVRPIVVKECDRCAWWEVCRPQLSEHDLSLRIEKSPLDVREISVLRAQGIETVDDLAHVDLETFLVDYLPEVRHRGGAEERLRTAHRRARLVAQGIELERLTSGPVHVDAGEIEIDLDIETAATDRVYLWGFWLHDTVSGEQRYVEFSRFEDLDAAAEHALAHEAMDWLRSVVHSGRRVRVYHYSDYETVRLRRLLERSGDEALAWAVSWVPEGFVDLFWLVRQHFFGTHGLGLKMVAHQGAGFVWRDDDPGGLNSQRWFDEAVHSPDAEAAAAARIRVLQYNEDDVRATHALRAWLRTLS